MASAALQAACALLLGALGGAAHLALVRLRVGLLRRRGPRAVQATWPLGLVGPGAAALLAARACPGAAWLLPLGLLLPRLVFLGRRAPRGARP
jgi:hypothetical protein